MILIAGTWQSDASQGVTLTANAFSTLLGPAGTVVVFVCVLCFATTTMFTYSFYGSQCASFVFGSKHVNTYRLVFVVSIVLIAVISIESAVSLIDGSFALMAIPTMVSAIWLAPKVLEAAKIYFAKLDADDDTPDPQGRSANNPPNKNNKRLPDPTLENSDQREAHDLQPYLSIWPNPSRPPNTQNKPKNGCNGR